MGQSWTKEALPDLGQLVVPGKVLLLGEEQRAETVLTCGPKRAQDPEQH